MSRRVTFRSRDSDAYFELRDPKLERDGWLSCTAAFGDANGEAIVEFGMIPHYRQKMIECFEDLAASSLDRWNGVKVWHAEYEHVVVTARSDGSTVGLDVLIRFAPGDPDRCDETASGTLVIDAARVARAGEEIRSFTA